MKTIQFTIIFILICSGFASAAVSIGDNLVLTESSSLVFPDGSILSTTPSTSKSYYVQSFQPDLSNTWLTSDTWEKLSGLSEFVIHRDANIAKINISLNVGIFSTNWCSLAIYVDDTLVSNCINSFSGVLNSTTFNNYNIACDVVLTSGPHFIELFHKSQYCHFFNSPDIELRNSHFTIQEVQP